MSTTNKKGIQMNIEIAAFAMQPQPTAQAVA
jgi:hypothetical protein